MRYCPIPANMKAVPKVGDSYPIQLIIGAANMKRPMAKAKKLTEDKPKFTR